MKTIIAQLREAANAEDGEVLHALLINDTGGEPEGFLVEVQAEGRAIGFALREREVLLEDGAGADGPSVIADPVNAGDAVRRFNGGRVVAEHERLGVDVLEPVVAGEEAVFGRDLVIDSGVDTVAVERIGSRDEIVIDVALAESGLGGIGVIGQHRLCDGVDESGRDDVAGEGATDVAGCAGGTIRIEPSVWRGSRRAMNWW